MPLRTSLRSRVVSGVLAVLALGLLATAPGTVDPRWSVVSAAALATIAIFGAPAICPVLFVLVTFLPEHSQTRWGVRSAADFATFYNTRPIAAVPVSVFDVVVAGACLVWLSTTRTLGAGGLLRDLARSRLGKALGLAAGVTCLALVMGLFGLGSGYEAYHVLRELRPPLYFLVLLVLAASQLADPARARSFAWLSAAAVSAHGVEGAIRFLLGIGRWASDRLMIYFDFADSLALAFGLCLVAAWWVGSRRSGRGRRVAPAAAAAAMGFAFVFSFRRSFWLGLAAGALLLLWRTPAHDRLRLVGFGLASLLGVAVLFAGVRTSQTVLFEGGGPAADAQIWQVGQRLASIADTTTEPSNRFRVFDTMNAALAVYDSPAFGLGFGSRYRVVWSDVQQREFLEHVSRTSHNTYLYLAMKMGAAGLFAWMWVFWEVFRPPFAGSREGPQREIGLAVSATLVTAAVAALFMPLAYNVRPMVLLALVGGLGLGSARAPGSGS